MPDIASAGAGTSVSSSNGSSQAISTGNQGSNTATAEPKVGWAGEQGHESESSRANQEHEEVDSEAGDDLDLGEFGEDSDFDSETLSDTDQNQPTSFKDLFEQLKSQDPKVAKAAEKALKRDFFENRRYKQIPGFETPEKAREVADKLEALGGIEGVESETAEAATLWNMLAAGDPAILDSLEAEYGDGLAKLAPHVISRYEKSDPQGWAHDMSKIFMATLNSAPAGGISALAAFNAIAQKFPEVAKSAEFQRIAEVVNAVNDIAARAPEKRQQAETKASARERQLAEKENQLYRKEVSAKVEPLTRQIGLNALNQVIKGRQLSAEQKKSLLGDIIGSKENPVGEVGRLLAKNADFQKNAKALLASGETDKFIRLVKSAMERTMPLAARNVWKKYYGISGLSQADRSQRTAEGSARTEAGGGGAASGAIKTSTPQPQDVDWRRMRAEKGRDGAEDMFMFQRRYYKKGDAKNIYSY